MKKKLLLFIMLIVAQQIASAQNFGGILADKDENPLSGAKIFIVEDSLSTLTDVDGRWTVELPDSTPKTIVFHKEGYTYEQIINQKPDTALYIILRTAVKSYATYREKEYITDDCSSVNIPDDPEWNAAFKISNLKGDLAPDPTYTRRDPSAVITVNEKYYVWYSYSLTHDEAKLAPWDLNDLYYATSTDGITWEEQGLAVGRGDEGAFDFRSVFTTEILAHDGQYYLVYQAAADEDGIYNRNTVGMAFADSPDGPWTKLQEPVLRPTYTNDLFFDNNAVHDPCIVPYNNKFYLYYKGECNCMNDQDCVRWCNPICGLNKQVKWGVAIAENPTGPFVKSVYNPVTNTGHEVMVWPYKDGIAILQHQDGPEARSIQFAENGFDFNIKGKVSNFPEAAGLYRTEKSDSNPHAGITWGLGHKLMWNAGPHGWMHIYRFDIKNAPSAVTGKAEKQDGQNSVDLSVYPNPTNGGLLITASQKISSISAYDIRGRRYNLDENNGSLDISTLSSGIYILHTEFKDGSFAKQKFTKMK